jgi:nitrogen fixation-related uncharacterized protein
MNTDQLQHLQDHHDIVALTHAYCWALDTKQWDDLDNVFLPDATANLGGTEHVDRESIKGRIRKALQSLDDSQHIVATHQITIDGDKARSRCYLHAQHVLRRAEGGPNYIVAGRYEDQLRRTPAGWRIARRDLIVMWTDGNINVTRQK